MFIIGILLMVGSGVGIFHLWAEPMKYTIGSGVVLHILYLLGLLFGFALMVSS